jgi:Opioid growth factor receptor (OGFr) conserved region
MTCNWLSADRRELCSTLIFDYWQGPALAPVVEAPQITEQANEIALEQKFSTGLRGNPPNLDVVFRRKETGGHVPAIESKFTEPYDERDHAGFASSYFEYRGLWDGLPLCRDLADLINGAEQFTCLNAAQLLKHILGLYRNHKQHGFTLLYLWYDVRGSDAAETQRKEIEKFRQIVSREVSFRSMTHQELFARLLPYIRATDYAEYLSSRYYPTLNSLIIAFYSGTGPDNRGRYLHEIQQWADDRLEGVHDYIQWLFPLPEPSGFNVAAPVLNSDSIQEFRVRSDL